MHNDNNMVHKIHNRKPVCFIVVELAQHCRSVDLCPLLRPLQTPVACPSSLKTTALITFCLIHIEQAFISCMDREKDPTERNWQNLLNNRNQCLTLSLKATGIKSCPLYHSWCHYSQYSPAWWDTRNHAHKRELNIVCVSEMQNPTVGHMPFQRGSLYKEMIVLCAEVKNRIPTKSCCIENSGQGCTVSLSSWQAHHLLWLLSHQQPGCHEFGDKEKIK